MQLPRVSDIAGQALNNLDGCFLPIDVAAIVKSLGDVELCKDVLIGDSYLSFIGRFGYQIIINSKKNRVRQRFSIAHELGHYYLHKNGVALSGGLESDSAEVELWCNKFAAELLMPFSCVARDIDDKKIKYYPFNIQTLSKIYDVSLESMLWRITEVSTLNVIYIILENGRFRSRFYPSKKTPIPFHRIETKLQKILPRVIDRECVVVDGARQVIVQRRDDMNHLTRYLVVIY